MTTCNNASERTRWLSLQPPPIRYEPISPYPEFTKDALDMRRKAEILQYNKNNNSKLTGRQRYTQIVSGLGVKRTTASCPDDLYLASPTSSCDVPGPIVNLYYDKDVPLYKYAERVDTNATVDYEPDAWTYYTSNNILSLDGSANTLTSLAIVLPTATTHQFTIITPIGVYIAGESGNSGSVKISTVEVIVTYNGQKVNIMYPVLSGIITQDVSFNSTGSGTFYCYQYLGNLAIQNMILQTYTGYVYDIKLLITFVKTGITAPNKQLIVGAVYNISAANSHVASNCTITTTPAINTATRQEFRIG
jgi:hypothetical protein